MGKTISNLVRRFPGLTKALLRVGWIRRLVNDLIINRFAEAATPRPRPFSLKAPYTSWGSLTDRRYTGRHLPEVEGARDLPPLEDVVALWRREPGKEQLSFDTSMLFSYFAQWFTDSFLRTDLRDRKRNYSNHEIDFCQLYGMNERQTKILRLGDGGKLKSQEIEGEVYPPFLFDPDTWTPKNWTWGEPEFEHLHERDKLEFIFQRVPEDRLRHMFVTGLEHGNSNVGYTLLNIIALREHNRICDLLAAAYPDWGDDRLFETARNVMIVILLKIVAGDYVAHISSLDFPFKVTPGMAERQRWYRTNWITIEFNLLYRWHSMVPDELVVGDRRYDPDAYRSNPPLILKHGVDALIDAASRQLTGRIGLGNTPEMFFLPMPIKTKDAGDERSIQERTVQMGRDFRLRSMNEYRRAFSLEPLAGFEALTDDPALRDKLRALYGTIDKVEWHVGIFAEKHAPKAMLGELMTTMVAYDAFTHALTNPLLSENVFNVDTFSKEGMEVIARTDTLADLVSRNVRDPGGVLASFKALSEVPGSYGLPVIGRLWDTLDFLFVSGWTGFFEKRRARHGSTVFKANLFQPTVVILDHEGFAPLHDWDGRLEKDHGFGWAVPPMPLTGGVVPSVFQADPSHRAHKALYLDILRDQADSLGETFERAFEERAEAWLGRGRFGFAEELERLAAGFVFAWYFGARPDLESVRYVYSHIFTHFPLGLMKLIPWSPYNRSLPMHEALMRFVKGSPRFEQHAALAERHGLTDREALASQLLFLTGMNNFLGLQGMSKALVGELSRQPGLADSLRGEIEAAEAAAEGPLSLAALDKLDLMDRAMKEVMRLHPPVFFTFGRASRDFALRSKSGSFKIAKGDHLMGTIPMAHLDGDVFAEPKRFDPERFRDPAATRNLIWPHGAHDAKVTPEGHICPGKNVAMLYGKLLCRALVTGFSWELESPPEWDDRKFSLNVASPIGPMTVRRFARRAER